MHGTSENQVTTVLSYFCSLFSLIKSFLIIFHPPYSVLILIALARSKIPYNSFHVSVILSLLVKNHVTIWLKTNS